MKIKKNLSIPSTMTMEGLDYLGMMARSVPENGVIVEIGPLFGSSTWVLAKNAHPSVKVFSIDTWEPAAWIDKVEAKFENCMPFSKEAFLHYTADCPNVTAIQGWSPAVVEDWNLPIDMFFDDATHGDPGFSENVNFFLPFVKTGGILCGDDYSVGWPDIVRVVDELGKNWGSKPEVIGRVWAMTRPEDGVTDTPFVYDSISQITIPSVRLSTQTKSGENYNLPNHVWSGALHKKDRLEKLSMTLDDINAEELELEWKVKDGMGKVHGPYNSGDEHCANEDDWIAAIAINLSGKDAAKYSIDYQASFCWYAGAGKRYPVSNMTSDGGFVAETNSKVAITALKVKVTEKESLIKKVRSKLMSLTNS